MVIGVPKEIKTNENRVALVPAGVQALRARGHQVVVESRAGDGSGFGDRLYSDAGAEVVDTAEEVWERANLIVKVKEPIEAEWPRIREEQVLFTYFHLAASEELTRAVLDSGGVAIAYETVQGESGELPLLTPMSEVAGRMAVQEGAKHLGVLNGGRGVLLGGVPGVLPGDVVIIGGGVVGTNAAKIAAGLGARVTVLDVSLERLRYLSDVLAPSVDLVFSNRYNIREHLARADLLVGAVLVPGRKAPMLVRRDDLSEMRAGAVIVDVAVDQGGCVETIEPTTHEDPVYVIDDVVHYGVANMPGAVPRTSTLALTNATLPYVQKLADHGWRRACERDPTLGLGVNAVEGALTHSGVAEAFGLEYEAVAGHLHARA